MSDLAVADPGSALEQAADPGAFVVLCLERGKTWLTEALNNGDLDAIVNAKGWAETLRVATVQKQLGHDAELVASELVRRAEHALGQGVRAGQAAGVLRRKSETTVGHEVANGSPTPYFSNKAERQDAYAMTDGVADEQFEQAIEQAKAEKNLTRANVVRKVADAKAPVDRVVQARDMAATGHTTRQIAQTLGYSSVGTASDFLKRHGIDVPADRVGGLARTRRIDSDRIVEETATALEGLCIGVRLVDFADVDPERIEEWVASLSGSIRKLSSFTRQLKETAQ